MSVMVDESANLPRDDGYDEKDWKGRSSSDGFDREHTPLISQVFIDHLVSMGVDARNVGWFAAEMEAANEDGGRVNAWQTLCNELDYSEDMIEASSFQQEAAAQTQKEAEDFLRREMADVDGDLGLEFLPYDSVVDLWIMKHKMETKGYLKWRIALQLRRELEGVLRKVVGD
jgi:hypothetical protein